jgi:sterol 3beta-glucosyltransferase
MPDFLNKEERETLPEKMQMLKDICYSCYPACMQPDPEDDEARPFLADAIISNPVSYGHIHCAEALSIPLHIMFPQPWSPTKMFPHPLSGQPLSNPWSRRNYSSYKMVDDFTWLGLGTMINKFRKKVLNLEPIRAGEHAPSLLNDNRVPISHMWSPSFVSKCVDWPEHVDVVGEFRSSVGDETSWYVPPTKLAGFLAKGEKPLYIGFGSMVIEDSACLLELVKDAATLIGCRILLQSGWTKWADDNELVCEGVMVVGSMPHDWLFDQVAGVIHHGGAGTTSAGLRAGKPTFICPFFGDQHFWAEMVHRAGCGPPGCRIQDLTSEKLIESLQTLRSAEVIENAKELGKLMSAENGVANGVKSFYRNLPLANMICEVSIFDDQSSRLATVYCPDCDLKMCEAAHKVVHRRGSGREKHVCIPFRSCRWGVVGPAGIVSGAVEGLVTVGYEMAGGLYDLFAKPIKGAAKNGIIGAGAGAVNGLVNLFARPLKGGKILVDKVASGAVGTARKSSVVEGALVRSDLISSGYGINENIAKIFTSL